MSEPSEEELVAFRDAQRNFVEAAGRLTEAWKPDFGDLTSDVYPGRLPSCDEFYHELIQWEEDSQPEIEQAIAKAEAQGKAERDAEESLEFLERTAKAQVVDDFQAVRGTVVEVTSVIGYDASGEMVEVNGRFRVRVDNTPVDLLVVRNGDFQGHWNVTPAPPFAPYKELENLGSFWTVGSTYSIEDGQVHGTKNYSA